MTSFYDLRDFFAEQGYKVIIAADGETKMHTVQNKDVILKNVPGGVASSFDILAQASKCTYIARARTAEDMLAVDKKNKVLIHGEEEEYTIKRIALTEEEIEKYYLGYSNQTLWPLCHVAFEKPVFNKEWYEGYKDVNKKFAKAIKEEISGKTFVWIHDYQLSLVPLYLGRQKDVVVSMFWHIPWPTWEIFRILPEKKDILWSLLSCDFVGFHRGYQAHNFMETVQRELPVMRDEEKRQIKFDKNTTTIRNLPLGIDVDVIKRVVAPPVEDSMLMRLLREMVGDYTLPKNVQAKDSNDKLAGFFEKYQVILGVDRLDYTKGLPYRLRAIETFFKNYPQYREKVVYIGIMSPSRSKIPSYQALKKEVDSLTKEINEAYATESWKPIHLIHQSFSRNDVMDLFKKARLNLVTPLDDGMNLVSKEFIIAQSFSRDPGMLVLSQFAGSAIDLGAALIVNPYDVEQVAESIKKGLEMSQAEKKERIADMIEHMEQRNIYAWAEEFVREAITASKENKNW